VGEGGEEVVEVGVGEDAGDFEVEMATETWLKGMRRVGRRRERSERAQGEGSSEVSNGRERRKGKKTNR
jgi:hypothetical protein